jgi:RHS repeat-associated protein
MKSAEGITTVFLYDFDGNIIAEGQLDGSIISDYLYIFGNRIAIVDVETGAYYYYLNNYLGTPILMTNDNGEVVWEASYKPFGEALISSGMGVINNFRFPGQYYDQYTEINYNYHRYYEPNIGRYLSPDPVGIVGNNSLFIYVQNDPINFYDPHGLIKWNVVGEGAIIAFGGGATIAGGALASFTVVWSVGGAPAVLIGSAALAWGISQMIVGFMDNELPFLGIIEAIILNTTAPGLLQDELLGLNALGNMLLTGRTAPNNIGKVNDALQSGYSIYKSGSKIKESIYSEYPALSSCH